MRLENKIKTWFVLPCATAFIYGAAIIGTVWYHVLSSELPGGRHGPLDAYRHVLASAYVSHTLGPLGPSAVKLVTLVMESGGKKSNAMDRHNNFIGMALGQRANTLEQIESHTENLVKNGMIESPQPGRVTWLSESEWIDRKLF